MRGLMLTLATVTTISVFISTAMADSRRIISLDGTWQIAEGGMDRQPERFDHTTAVPGLVDMATPAFADVGKKSDRRQAFWYRRTFTVDGSIPPAAQLKVLKAAYGTAVWINGQSAGEHLPCFTPGYFDAKSLLKGDGQENEIVVRVGAFLDALPPTLPNGKDFEKVLYTPGIYDSVQLILTGAPHIVRVQTVPDIESKSVRVAAALWSDQPVSMDLRCTVREVASGKTVGRATIQIDPAREANVDVKIPIEGCRLWSPEDPFLYVLEASTGQDDVSVRFGMRSFRLDPATGRAILNGKPYYLRGTNVCIFRYFEEPARGNTPWRAEWVRKLHQAFRDMNWNSARYCIGFPPEIWYDIADELGFLIQDEFPIWGGGPWDVEELSQEYREWMQERWNHPSVVIWDAQNETAGTEQTGKALQAVRSLDLSNRPWDNGWAIPQAQTDVFEAHPYVFANPEDRLSRLPALGDGYLGSPIANKHHNPMIINEYSWLWLNRDGTPTTLTTKVYNSLLGANATPPQRRHLYARYTAALTEFWRAQRRFAGIMHFCGLTYSRPGGQTCDNFTDVESFQIEPEFRKYVRDAFAPLALSIDYWAEDQTPEVSQDVPVIVINDTYEPSKGKVRLSIIDAQDKTLFEQVEPYEVEPVGCVRVAFKITTPAASGRYTLSAELQPDKGERVHSLRDLEILTAEQRLARDGLALNKPVAASSSVTVGNESFLASFAFDGKRSTRWSSEFSDPQWIAVDLGEPITISRVELSWENAFASAYAIQVSIDGKAWTDVYHTEKGQGAREVIRFDPVRAQYVRLFGTKRATPFGYSLWEFKVFP